MTLGSGETEKRHAFFPERPRGVRARGRFALPDDSRGSVVDVQETSVGFKADLRRGAGKI